MEIALIGKFIGWLPKVAKIFKPFKPEITQFRINYKEQTAKLFYKLDLGSDNIRKTIGKIEIPILRNYKIESFLDEGFGNIKQYIKVSKDNTKYIIKTNQLPPCKYFQIELNGKVDLDILNNIVRVQPAINKNNTLTYDRYWLDVMIRDMDTLEKLYHYLEINDINFFVKVSTQRYFTPELPKSLTRSLKSINDFLRAGKGQNRGELFKAWRRYNKASNVDLEDIARYFEDLTKSINLENFISLDLPFYTGKIGDFNTHNVIPSNFMVEAITDLSFKKPTASGFLEFHKKNFKKTVKEKIEERWGE